MLETFTLDFDPCLMQAYIFVKNFIIDLSQNKVRIDPAIETRYKHMYSA